MKIFLPVMLSFCFFSLNANAHIVMGVPVGEVMTEGGEPLNFPRAYGDVMKLVAANYRQRLTKVNFPSVNANRIWRSANPAMVIVGRARRMLIDGRTTLIFSSPERAEIFLRDFENENSSRIYLVFDSHKATGYFLPKVHESDLWIAKIDHLSSMAQEMVPLTEYVDERISCSSHLTGGTSTNFFAERF